MFVQHRVFQGCQCNSAVALPLSINDCITDRSASPGFRLLRVEEDYGPPASRGTLGVGEGMRLRKAGLRAGRT